MLGFSNWLKGEQSHEIVAQPGDNLDSMVEFAKKESLAKGTVVLVFNKKRYTFKNGEYVRS